MRRLRRENRVQQAARRVGLPVIKLHSLRHSCASVALAAGVPARVAQLQLGHSSVSTTLNLYSAVLPEAEQAAVDRVAGLIFG